MIHHILLERYCHMKRSAQADLLCVIAQRHQDLSTTPKTSSAFRFKCAILTPSHCGWCSALHDRGAVLREDRAANPITTERREEVRDRVGEGRGRGEGSSRRGDMDSNGDAGGRKRRGSSVGEGRGPGEKGAKESGLSMEGARGEGARS